jgi:hypothetical protein
MSQCRAASRVLSRRREAPGCLSAKSRANCSDRRWAPLPEEPARSSETRGSDAGRLETDQDFHVVLSDPQGRTMIA